MTNETKEEFPPIKGGDLPTNVPPRMISLQRIKEVETQILQEVMDDLTLLHKRKEIDDNGFCTVRDLLHSKALQDKK
jgi:hypothetical protein